MTTNDAAGPSVEEAVKRIKSSTRPFAADLRLVLSALSARDERIKGLEADFAASLEHDAELDAAIFKQIDRANAAEAALASLQAELRAAVMVLEPFAKASDEVAADIPGKLRITEESWPRITFNDLRAASSLHARLKTLTGVNTDG